ncbi:MAG: MATE family efflux transporter [Gammaproteobacteria bacterium]|nr:MATE family efflux transporter [Gammaproteobacteria bacterium]
MRLLRAHKCYRNRFMNLREEIRQTTKLTLPLVAGNVATLSMGFVDTVMVGHLGARELAAVGLGGAVWMTYTLFVIGMTMVLAPLISHLTGEGRRSEVGGLVHQMLYLALAMGGLLWLALNGSQLLLVWVGVEETIIPLVMDYLRAIAWGAPLFVLFLLLRFASEGLSLTRTTMYFGFLGLLINIPANYVLIFGHLGFPQMGAEGAGYASSLVQVLQAISIGLFVWLNPAFAGTQIFAPLQRPDWRELKRLLYLGMPIAISVFIEGSLFGAVALLLGVLGTTVVAAHQVAINFSGLLFMVPLGLSMAITVRIGNAVGRSDMAGARGAAKAGALLVLLTQISGAMLILIFSEQIAHLYTNDQAVIAMVMELLVLAAIFQIPDGIQVATAGALRGLKDTQIPMLYILVAYWGIGIPTGYYLGLYLGKGAAGMWWGLIIGLSVAAVLLALRFLHLLKRPVAQFQR